MAYAGVEKLRYVVTKTDGASSGLIGSDLEELWVAVAKLAGHAHMFGGGITFFKFLALVAAIYLLVLDRTNWKTNILTTLLVPYIFLTLPNMIFFWLRGEVGKWVTFIGVVLRLFLPKYFPEWLELPGSVLLLLLVAPDLLVYHVKDGYLGAFICLGIACYLLHEHIQASGGFRNAFSGPNGISNTVGIILLLVYPVWVLIVRFL